MRGIKKEGVSPVIATVLLIVLVLVIALIIFLFLRGINEEVITKFEGETIKITCGKVAFEASYSDSEKVMSVSNTGNIPIYDMWVKIVKEGGGYIETSFRDLEGAGWPESGLIQGDGANVDLSGEDLEGLEEIVVNPELVGKTESGAVSSYVCKQEIYGTRIIV